MSGLPLFDPGHDVETRPRYVQLSFPGFEDSLTECDRLRMAHPSFVETRPFQPSELIPPRYVQLSFPGFE